MKGIKYLWILGILFITFCCEGANKVIMKVEVSGNPKWTAVSAGENDFEVQLSKTDIKLLGEDVLKFHFKKLTEEHANKHVRVEEKEVLNLFELGKAYLNIKVEKLPSSFKCYYLCNSVGADSVENIEGLEKYIGEWVSIELSPENIWKLSRTSPKIDISRITRIFLGFHRVNKGEEGIIYIGPITSENVGKIINQKEEGKEEQKTKEITFKYNKVPTFEELKSIIKKVDYPIYLQEYHIWFTSPFGKDARNCWIHWVGNFEDNIEEPIGNGWRRNNGSIGYPLIGFYDSGVEDVIRWQIRCMKNAGLDGAFVQMYPLREDGTSFGRGEDIFEKVLKIAAEENFKVGIHDEIHFRRGWPAQEPDVMIERVAKAIKKFGEHPGYLKINGKPAYQFQCWDLFQKKLTFKDLEDILIKSEEKAGREIFFVVGIHPSSGATKINGIDAMLTCANSNFIKRFTYEESYIDWDGLEKYQVGPTREFKQEMKEKNIEYWMLGYAGFNNTCFSSQHKDWFDRRGGMTLVELLNKYSEEKPEGVILSSWNDWLENTALEPGFAYDDFSQDPYLYMRIIAAAKGKEFVPPPLPDPASIDPWIHSELYGIDHTPPLITQIIYSPLEPAIEVGAVDEHSGVKDAFALRYGNYCVRFTNPIETYKVNLFSIPTEEYYSEVDGIKALDISKSDSIFMKIPEFKITGDEWVHISYFDGKKGRIKINYPGEIIEFLDTNIPITDYAVAICSGDGKWKDKFIRIRGITKQGAENFWMVVKFIGDKEQKNESSPVLIGDISLINDFSTSIKGVARKIRDQENNGGSFVFNNFAPDGSVFDWVFIKAYDTKGNSSIPCGINLGFIKEKYKKQRIY